MKYRFKLVSRYETLKENYKITRDRSDSKYKDVQNVINKILRLTKHLNNLKNYKSITAKINYLKNGFKKCPECGSDVLNYISECCSYKCANKLKHITETPENKKALLKKYGVFNARNNKNTKGCVRDHLLSRRYGFDNNIDPEIISHPANCEIVLHSENVKRSNTNDNLITLEELLERIENWIE